MVIFFRVTQKPQEGTLGIKKNPEHFVREHGPGPFLKAFVWKSVTIYPRSTPAQLNCNSPNLVVLHNIYPEDTLFVVPIADYEGRIVKSK